MPRCGREDVRGGRRQYLLHSTCAPKWIRGQTSGVATVHPTKPTAATATATNHILLTGGPPVTMGDAPVSDAFHVAICNPTALINLVERVSPVLTNCAFAIVREEQFSGLRLNAIDTHHICCVNAQLHVAAGDITGEGEFVVNTAEFLAYLQAVDQASVLHLQGGATQDTVLLRTQDRVRCTAREYRINRIQREGENVGLTDMTTSLKVHVKTSVFTAYLNLCKRLKYTNVTFRVDEGPSRVKSGTVDRYFTMVTAGLQGAGARQTEVQWGVPNDTTCIDLEQAAAPPPGFDGTVPSDTNMVYQETFSRDFMSKFCRNIPGHDALFTEIQLCGPERPLIMHIDLGLEQSHVRFVLAPMLDDDE